MEAVLRKWKENLLDGEREYGFEGERMEGARMGGNGFKGEEERRGDGGGALRAWRERVRV